MIKWIKTLMRIVANYDEHIDYLKERINLTDKQAVRIISELNRTKEIIKERTELHVDIPHFRGYPCTVVVAGRYKNNDYVQVYQVFEDDFSHIVEHVKQASKYAELKNVDAPFQLREYIRKEVL